MCILISLMTLVITIDSYAVDGYTMRRYRVLLLGIFTSISLLLEMQNH